MKERLDPDNPSIEIAHISRGKDAPEGEKELSEPKLPESTLGRSALLHGSGSPMRLDRATGHLRFVELTIRCGNALSERSISCQITWDKEDFHINWRPLYLDTSDGHIPEEYWIGFSKLDNSGNQSPPRWYSMGETIYDDEHTMSVSFDYAGADPNKDRVLLCFAVKTNDGQIY